jgi:DNA-directed RNA polymerase subunit beta
MGTHMQCQAVPLISPQSPIVGTGMEGPISQMMGRVVYAPYDAIVTYADANKVTIKGKGEKKKKHIYYSFQRTSRQPLILKEQWLKPDKKLKKAIF